MGFSLESLTERSLVSRASVFTVGGRLQRTDGKGASFGVSVAGHHSL